MRSTTVELPELLTGRQTAEYIGVSEDTLAQDRYLGRGLPYVRVGRRIRYRASDIAAFLEANVVKAD
ncbi:helix-turn-helix domain-containing protein [Nocardia cyriacigeorgica]|uniref:helix-turn-helix domain-containing protein n=1 Tax=Nocardia cyriacigeorgica TaxID=135487 RepID=UPI0002DE44D4|nr:helix-turn-helix domain-containing protein [Nocardia cyriacigeorgica]TLF58472.1 helix-turn-helix domain-containing protein [Nocardia cyriacigeorgica]